MNWRGVVKRILYELRPGRFKWFWYYGCKIYFPKGNIVFRMACDQGIYEREVVRLVDRLLAPGSTYFDIGANIGLMAVTALSNCPDCNVVSVEASSSTLAYLGKTREDSGYSDRWIIVPKAIGAEIGEATFYEGSVAQGAFNGLQDTGRGGAKRPTSVEVTTIDQLWRDLGGPPVTVIKMDIEGGELNALDGAERCMSTMRPAIVLEWSRLNLLSYGISDDAILAVAARYDYEIFSVPGYAAVRSRAEMTLRMLETETFILMPSMDQRPTVS
jgi:FkbM family methyltransferase